MSGRNERLVIFDCDGVLVDSEPISIGVLTEIIAEAGADIPLDEAYRRFLGHSVRSIVADLAAGNGLAVTDLHLETMRERLYARFRGELGKDDAPAGLTGFAFHLGSRKRAGSAQVPSGFKKRLLTISP